MEKGAQGFAKILATDAVENEIDSEIGGEENVRVVLEQTEYLLLEGHEIVVLEQRRKSCDRSILSFFCNLNIICYCKGEIMEIRMSNSPFRIIGA